MTSGQMTYDLRRLRLHGLIERIPHTFRYQVTPGLCSALFLTRVHGCLLRSGLAELTDSARRCPPGSRPQPAPTKTALDELTRRPGIAVWPTTARRQQTRSAINRLDSICTAFAAQAP